MPKKITANLLPILTILTVVLLAFAVIVLGRYTMKWDMLNQFYPCRRFIAECFAQGKFPFWCPYINFGYPFYADPQSGVFYPFTWLFVATLGYSTYTIGLDYVLHVFIAGITFYALLQGFNLTRYASTAFAIVYCLCGVMISNAQHLPWIITMAWMPLIILNFNNVFEKRKWRSAIALGLFLSLGLTGGYPGFFIILFYFLVVYAMGQFVVKAIRKEWKLMGRWVLLFSLAALVFVILSGGYLYSFISSLPYIARGKPVTLKEANAVAVTGHALLSFLFPFATASSSIKLGTDISMANIYCGLFALPLIVLAFIKVRLPAFTKAFFVFALICFAAALGSKLGARTFFYNYLPGLNMLRHAAIFRVFGVFGFVFIAAIGFNYLLNTSYSSNSSRYSKIIFSAYLLLVVAGIIVMITKYGFVAPVVPFKAYTVRGFNVSKNYLAHIEVQLCFQLLLSLLFVVVLFRTGNKQKQLLLSGIIIMDVLIAAWLNLPATVISDVKPAVLQAKLDKLEVPVNTILQKPVESYTHFSDGTTLPIWFNTSFYKRVPAKDGFNSFYLQNVDDLNTSNRLDYFMKKPLAFFNQPVNQCSLKKFEANEISVDCKVSVSDTLPLQQNFYPGWKAFIDGGEVALNNELCNMYVVVSQGQHTITFSYQQPLVKVMFTVSMLCFLVLFAGLALTSAYKSN